MSFGNRTKLPEGSQPALFTLPPPPPTLTPRQQHALTIIQQAAPDSVTADEIGAALCAYANRHPAGERCQYDAQNGNQMLRALRAKKLVTYRTRTGWVPTNNTRPVETPRGMLPPDQELPY